MSKVVALLPARERKEQFRKLDIEANDGLDTHADSLKLWEDAFDDVCDNALRKAIEERARRKGHAECIAFLRGELKLLIQLARAEEAMRK